jgi:hypothetical protein
MMKKILHEYRKYIFLSSMIFFVFSIFFIILTQIDDRFSSYDDAIMEIKDDSVVPKSVKVHRASYDDMRIYIEFSDKNLDGEESGKILAVYTYNSEDQNGLKYYFQGNADYGLFYLELTNNQTFPAYVLGHQFHPFIVLGIISFIFGLFTCIISRIKWHDKAVEVLNDMDEKKSTHDTNIIDTEDM